ncbi:MAG: hypothetical protein AB1586_21315 [Pseudomonadota bacterium]
MSPSFRRRHHRSIFSIVDHLMLLLGGKRLRYSARWLILPLVLLLSCPPPASAQYWGSISRTGYPNVDIVGGSCFAVAYQAFMSFYPEYEQYLSKFYFSNPADCHVEAWYGGAILGSGSGWYICKPGLTQPYHQAVCVTQADVARPKGGTCTATGNPTSPVGGIPMSPVRGNPMSLLLGDPMSPLAQRLVEHVVDVSTAGAVPPQL